jgi:IclR helix-turn-helix domain
VQEEEARSNGDVQSVQRALTILRMLADERRPPRITDIVERTALPPAHLADVAGRQTRHIDQITATGGAELHTLGNPLTPFSICLEGQLDMLDRNYSH